MVRAFGGQKLKTQVLLDCLRPELTNSACLVSQVAPGILRPAP